MLAASHAIAGAIIAKSVSSPEIGYGLAFLSHPLLDLFPHWDLHTRSSTRKPLTIIWTSLLDASIGFGLGFLLFGSLVETKILLFTMFIAQLPDWLESPYSVLGWKFPPFSTVKKIQHYIHSKMDFPWGIVPQLALFALAIYLA
jgi:hypothetical protein